MAKKTLNTDASVGTSFHNVTINCSINDLINILGIPEYEGNTGEDKVNFEWICETKDGDIFTIYDWKEYRPISRNENIEWHIGSRNKAISYEAYEELACMISGLK